MVGQVIFVFILVLLLAFLVSVGITYSIRTQVQRNYPNDEKLANVIGKGESHDIDHEINKFEKLGGPDITANREAMCEFRDRLNHRIDTAHLPNDERHRLRDRVQSVAAKIENALNLNDAANL